MRPVAAVGLVLAILMLVLGSGWLLRQSGSRQTQPGLSPTVQAARPTPPIEGVVAPDATMSAPAATSAAVPLAIGTLVGVRETARPAGAAASGSEAVEATSTPTLAAAEQHSGVPAAQNGAPGPPISAAEAQAPSAAPAAADDGVAQAEPGGTYTGLPVALPVNAVLQGAEVPVGPNSVQSAGARAFAQRLLTRAQTQDPNLVEELGLRQVAEQTLMNELARAVPIGMLRPVRLQQGSITVQIDVVATLPDTTTASLRLSRSGSVPAVGLAVGVAGRVEPDYLPDLVAVAAVAYR